MQKALSLAETALGKVSPNPAVGAVIVNNGQIVGQGFTQPPGGDHAEIVAIKQAGQAARGADLFLTLEPCCHYGRTPPCTDAIIQAGIARVNVSMIDPNPRVSGKGLALLQKAGIETTTGRGEDRARRIMEAYIKYVTTGLPFVTAKFAMSLDGKIATFTGDSKWISNKLSRSFSHGLRARNDAVLTGINTVLADNPQLTARDVAGQPFSWQPARVIVDTYAQTPLDATVLQETGKTIIAVGENTSEESKSNLREKGAELLELPVINGFIDLRQLLGQLGSIEITSVMVEGGAAIMGSLFDQGLVDKVIAFVAPVIIGGEKAKTPVGGLGAEKIEDALRLSDIEVERFETDIMISGYVKR